MSMIELRGKRALVTGSTQGIGLAIARELARSGAEVVLHGLPGDDAHAAARAAIAEVSVHPVQSLTHDLADAHQVERMMTAVLGDGPLDILVNNAGIQHTSSLAEMPREK
jgi:3-hydroxybutyrate dehydrogenase